MSKGSTQRPKGLVTDKKLLENWERIFGSKPNNNQDEAVRKGEEHGNT